MQFSSEAEMATNTVMIKLNNSLFLGEGSHRATYRHPDDKKKCLKIVKAGSLEKRRKNNSKWYKRLRKLSSFDETHKDLQAYRQFKDNEEKLKHIPRFYGMVETSLGSAMLLDLIINEDGSPALSLADHLKSGKNRDELREALIVLGTHLIKRAIVVRDFSMGDLLVRENRDGNLKLYVIDGLGGTELIPFSKVPFFARLKATRKVQRFYGKVTQSYPDLALPAGRTRD